MLSLLVRRENDVMSKFRDTYCTTLVLPFFSKPGTICVCLNLWHWSCCCKVQFISPCSQLLLAIIGFFFLLPRLREHDSGLSREFVFVRGLNMDLCLVIRSIILVFWCSLEEAALKGGEGEEQSRVKSHKVYNRQPESFHLVETPEETPSIELKNQQDQCWKKKSCLAVELLH